MGHHRATTTDLVDPPLRLVDGPSFAAQYEDIFLFEAYDFPYEGACPTIIDGGANVGTAVIWWRARWPEARIIAFEPDPGIFEVLKWNTRHLQGLELHRSALGSGSSDSFLPDGADGGRLARPDDPSEALIPVDTVRLGDVLDGLSVVDLLKLDIEGAETAVLHQAERRLGQVVRIFVEYHSFSDELQSLSDLLGLLRRNGFRYYIETQARTVRPFRRVQMGHQMDLQCNIFASRDRSRSHEHLEIKVLAGVRPDVETRGAGAEEREGGSSHLSGRGRLI